jgi:hypothetical protein
MTYSAKVTVTSKGATYALQVATGNDVPGDVAAAYGLADPLTITQKLQDNSRGIMAHPEPDEATVTIIAPDSTTYAAMNLGDPVGVQVYPQGAFAGTPVEFYGRIAQMSARPHDLGVLITLSCIDYTADLAQLQVGGTAYPIEMAYDRVKRPWDELGLPRPARLPAAWILTTSPLVAARAAGYTDLYSLQVETLDSWSFEAWKDEDFNALPVVGSPAHTVSYRPYLIQNITAGLLDPTTPYSIRVGRPWTRRVMYAPPLRVTNLAGTRRVTAAAADSSPSTGAPILDAGKVEFGITMAQTKGDQLPNVTIAVDAQGNRYTWDWRATNPSWATGGTQQFGAGGYKLDPVLNPQGPPILQEVDSILDVTDAATPALSPAGIAQAFRVPFAPDTRAAWAVGTMSYQAWADGVWRRPELTELLTVARGATGKLPNNREWISGHVVATTLRIAKGRPTIDIDVVTPSFDFVADRQQQGASLGVASMDSPVLTGVTLAQLYARDTFNDYALTRGS